MVPVNTQKPTIFGALGLGGELFGTVGLWTNFPTSFAYQWMHALTDGTGGVLTDDLGNPLGAEIVGATTANYVLVGSDVGEIMFLEVTAFNGSGSGIADSVVGSQPVSPTKVPTEITDTIRLKLPVDCILGGDPRNLEQGWRTWDVRAPNMKTSVRMIPGHVVKIE